MNNNYLIHFGIKGMKWGVRKSKKQKKISSRQRIKAKQEARIEASRRVPIDSPDSGVLEGRYIVDNKKYDKWVEKHNAVYEEIFKQKISELGG